MLATLLIPVALGKPLPDDAARGSVPAGAPFEVIALHRDDAYYRAERETIVGLRCTADQSLTRTDPDGFYAGAASCDGKTRSFFKVALRITGDIPAVVAEAGPQAPAGSVGGETPHRPFLVADIHPDDAYFGSKEEVVGLLCVSGPDGLHENSPGWWGGKADCQDDSNRYFYQAAIQVDLPAILAGTPFRIVDVGPLDAYASEKNPLVGRSCTATGDLLADAGWFSGPMQCGSDTFVFRQVALTTGDRPVVAKPVQAPPPPDAPGAPPGDIEARYDGPTVRAKTAVRIVNVGDYDGWSFRRDALVGQDCKVRKPLEPIGEGWYQGLLVCSGSQLAFTQVAVSLR